MSEITPDKKGIRLFRKIIQLIPAPTLLGLVLSLIAVALGWLFSVDPTIVFLVIIVLMCLAWRLQKEYVLPLDNNIGIIVYMLCGHIPYLVIHYLF